MDVISRHTAHAFKGVNVPIKYLQMNEKCLIQSNGFHLKKLI